MRERRTRKKKQKLFLKMSCKECSILLGDEMAAGQCTENLYTSNWDPLLECALFIFVYKRLQTCGLGSFSLGLEARDSLFPV